MKKPVPPPASNVASTACSIFVSTMRPWLYTKDSAAFIMRSTRQPQPDTSMRIGECGGRKTRCIKGEDFRTVDKLSTIEARSFWNRKAAVIIIVEKNRRAYCVKKQITQYRFNAIGAISINHKELHCVLVASKRNKNAMQRTKYPFIV